MHTQKNSFMRSQITTSKNQGFGILEFILVTIITVFAMAATYMVYDSVSKNASTVKFTTGFTKLQSNMEDIVLANKAFMSAHSTLSYSTMGDVCKGASPSGGPFVIVPDKCYVPKSFATVAGDLVFSGYANVNQQNIPSGEHKTKVRIGFSFWNIPEYMCIEVANTQYSRWDQVIINNQTIKSVGMGVPAAFELRKKDQIVTACAAEAMSFFGSGVKMSFQRSYDLAPVMTVSNTIRNRSYCYRRWKCWEDGGSCKVIGATVSSLADYRATYCGALAP